jgi:hypothetical protein
MTQSVPKNGPGASSSPPDSNASIVDQELAEAIRTGLGHFGPESLVENLVYMLEVDYSVNINSLSNDPSSLRSALSKMFGGASYVVEYKICQALARQLGIDGEGKSLEQLIQLLKQSKLEKDNLNLA